MTEDEIGTSIAGTVLALYKLEGKLLKELDEETAFRNCLKQLDKGEVVINASGFVIPRSLMWTGESFLEKYGNDWEKYKKKALGE